MMVPQFMEKFPDIGEKKTMKFVFKTRNFVVTFKELCI